MDDEIAVVDVIQKALRRRGDHVLVAYSVAEGQVLFAEARGAFDYAIIDLTLPDGDGLALARDLHLRSPKTRIILTTGGHNPVVAEFGVLLKPFSIDELWAAIA